VVLMANRAQCGHASTLDIQGLEPGVYSVTQMNTLTGEAETAQVQTMQDGTLTVLAGGTGQDVALAIVRTDSSG